MTMSDETIPRVQHGIMERPDGPMHEASGGLPHCMGPDDTACWCEPDVLTPCTACDAEAGDVLVTNREAYLPPCDACGGSGLMPATGQEADDDQLIVAHYDR